MLNTTAQVPGPGNSRPAPVTKKAPRWGVSLRLTVMGAACLIATLLMIWVCAYLAAALTTNWWYGPATITGCILAIAGCLSIGLAFAADEWMKP